MKLGLPGLHRNGAVEFREEAFGGAAGVDEGDVGWCGGVGEVAVGQGFELREEGAAYAAGAYHSDI